MYINLNVQGIYNHRVYNSLGGKKKLNPQTKPNKKTRTHKMVLLNLTPEKPVVTPALYTGKASGREVFKSFHLCIRLNSRSIHLVTLNEEQE